MWQKTDLIGYFASGLASISLVPQVWKVFTTKKADDLSYGMIAIIMMASILWQTHGWLKDDIPLRVASGITICVNIILMTLKFMYSRRYCDEIKLEPSTVDHDLLCCVIN